MEGINNHFGNYIQTNLLMYQGKNYDLNIMLELILTIPEGPGIIYNKTFIMLRIKIFFFIDTFTGFEIKFYDNSKKFSCLTFKNVDRKPFKANSTIKFIIKDPETFNPGDNFIFYLGNISVGLLINCNKKSCLHSITNPIQIGLQKNTSNLTGSNLNFGTN